jgi:hypothetical protein
MSSGEDWYDTVIAPALSAIGQQCQERGVAFVAVVEYEPGERGGTYLVPDDAGLEMSMLHLCARTVPNIDGYVINLHRMAKREGIDTSGSIVMNRMLKD